MGKLHELLAVEPDREGLYKIVLEEAKTTFQKKTDHFMGQIRKLEMFDQAEDKLNTVERKELVTTVKDKLLYVQEALQRYLDIVLQKEATNQEATADLIVDGVALAKDVPATFLLGLETKMKHLRGMYETLPTLDPGIKWTKDTKFGENVYVTEYPDEKFKTAKKFQHQVLVAPTDKHPAQVEKWEEQVPVGKYSTTAWSGKISSAEKSAQLGKIDKIIQGAKQARMRANNIEAINREIGKVLCDYINS